MAWRRGAHAAQREPEPKGDDPDWRTWLFLGGRGAGKTRAGAQALSFRALPGARLALVGPTFHDVREVMVEGPSGLIACAPPGLTPEWQASRKRLVWPSGAVAQAFSAEDPDGLRGPQFHFAWADEFCAWARPQETLAMLRLGLRLGNDPRLVVTTTPKPIAALRALMAEAGVAASRAKTSDNAEHLAPGFVDDLMSLYGGTRLAAQELDGQVVEALEGALWRAADLAACRGEVPTRLERVVVAVDPPASAGGDACGIVAAGRIGAHGFVLADRSARGLTPDGWAQRVSAAAAEFGAEAIVAEANMGGDMVRAVLQASGAPCRVKLVHASRGKRARAEPVAALYEQGRVTHGGAFAELEEELMGLGCEGERGSPDRADALVWALTELLLGGGAREPRLRVV